MDVQTAMRMKCVQERFSEDAPEGGSDEDVVRR